MKGISDKILLLLVALLSGCMVGPDFHQPEPPEANRYTEKPLPHQTAATPDIEGGHAQTFERGGNIPAQWWTLFESPKLNELIEQGIANSPDLKAAQATLLSAQEELRSLIGETLYPNVELELDTGRERLSSFDSLEGSPGETLDDFPPQLLSIYNASVSVSYVLDVFGANRRAIEAMRADVDMEAYELQATYLTLTSNIVTTAIQEGALRAQITATNSVINHEEQLFDLIQKQYQTGSISRFEVLAQETELAQTRAGLPPIENELAQTRHALAVLVGDYPGSKMPEFYLDDLHLPAELPVSIPSELINQRPDIKAAEELLHEATAIVGVTTANLLPSFPISASLGVNSDTLSDFFNSNNIYWNWEAAVLQPIFNGGALRAQRRAAIAELEAAFAEYQMVVLEGLQDVADTLSALDTDARTLQQAAIAETSAKEVMELTHKQYQLGGANYLDLIYAQTAYQATYLDRIDAQAARYADTAALFQALGGGWWNQYEDEYEYTEED